MRPQFKGLDLKSVKNKQLLQSLAEELIAEIGIKQNRLLSQFSDAPLDPTLLRRHYALSSQLIELLIDAFPSCPRSVSYAVDQLLYAQELMQEALSDASTI